MAAAFWYGLHSTRENIALTVSIKMGPLQALAKALKAKPPMAHVGILGMKNARSDALTNATVGAAHEFGTERLPKRSFLLEPIQDQIKNRVKDLIGDADIKRIIADKGMRGVTQDLGIIGVQIVADAFASGGFGKWPQSNYADKKVHQTLVETQQLRNSITYEVTGG